MVLTACIKVKLNVVLLRTILDVLLPFKNYFWKLKKFKIVLLKLVSWMYIPSPVPPWVHLWGTTSHFLYFRESPLFNRGWRDGREFFEKQNINTSKDNVWWKHWYPSGKEEIDTHATSGNHASSFAKDLNSSPVNHQRGGGDPCSRVPRE